MFNCLLAYIVTMVTGQAVMFTVVNSDTNVSCRLLLLRRSLFTMWLVLGHALFHHSLPVRFLTNDVFLPLPVYHVCVTVPSAMQMLLQAGFITGILLLIAVAFLMFYTSYLILTSVSLDEGGSLSTTITSFFYCMFVTVHFC